MIELFGHEHELDSFHEFCLGLISRLPRCIFPISHISFEERLLKGPPVVNLLNTTLLKSYLGPFVNLEADQPANVMLGRLVQYN